MIVLAPDCAAQIAKIYPLEHGNRSVRISFVVSALAILLSAGALHAQNYPSRPITIVVPLPAGGGGADLAEPIEREGGQLSEVEEAVAYFGFDVAMRSIGGNEVMLLSVHQLQSLAIGAATELNKDPG